MMTQSVMTQTANLSRTTAGTSISRAKPNSSGFEMFMDRNVKNTDSTEAQTKAKAAQTKDNQNNTGAAKSNKAYREDGRSNAEENTAVTDQDKAVKTEEASQKAPTDSDQLKTAQETAAALQAAEELTQNTAGDDVESSGAVELQEQLLSLLQSIQQAVMDLLQMTPEELEAMLKDQGLGLSDLADPQSLQQLVMTSNGSTDVMDFLTDGNLKAKFDQLVEQVETILKEADLKLSASQLKTALAELTAGNEQEVMLQTEGEMKDPGLLAAQQKADRNELSTDDGRKETHMNSGSEPKVEILQEAGKENGSKQTASEQGQSETFDQEAVSRYETFLNNLTKTVQEVAAEPMMEARTMELKEIAGQILERVKIVMKPEQTSMEMVLNPEHLGKVNLTVVSKDGTMTAQFKVQNEIAREAIESQLQTLKETLNSQGIKVEAIEVTVAGYSFGQSGNPSEEGQASDRNKSQGQKISLEEALLYNEQPEDDGSTADITGLRGTNIDMTA